MFKPAEEIEKGPFWLDVRASGALHTNAFS